MVQDVSSGNSVDEVTKSPRIRCRYEYLYEYSVADITDTLIMLGLGDLSSY